MASFKFPSIHFLYEQSVITIKRFPLAITSAIVSSISLLVFAELDGGEDYIWILHCFLCGYLGLPLFVSSTILSETRSLSIVPKSLINLGIILFLIGIYFSFPSDGAETSPYIRFSLFSLATHLLVAFIGFDFTKALNGFWQFNKSLFLRFLLSALYSIVLYLGIVLALVLVTSLFNMDIDEMIYLDLFILIAGIFNTWFFLAGVPKELNNLESEDSYPKSLRTLIIYVLLPLTGIYFLILYSYSFKVIWQWNWPQGIIAYMIIAVAVIGILSSLLAYPFYNIQKRTPLKVYQKIYFMVLLPMVLMLFAAIYIRIDQYGITINRYIILLLAIWLGAIGIYFSFFGKNIKIIPSTLFTLILISSIGPWGIFAVSESSQVSRLKSILEEAEILSDESILNEPTWIHSDTSQFLLEEGGINDHLLSDSLYWEVNSILSYINKYHRIEKIDVWFQQSIPEIKEHWGHLGTGLYVQLLGLKSWRDATGDSYHSFYMKYTERKTLPVRGYDYLINVENDIVYPDEASTDKASNWDFGISYYEGKILVKHGNDSAKIDLNKKYQELVSAYPAEENDRYNLPMETMTIEFESENLKVKLFIESLSGTEKVEYYQGSILIGLK